MKEKYFCSFKTFICFIIILYIVSYTNCLDVEIGLKYAVKQHCSVVLCNMVIRMKLEA